MVVVPVPKCQEIGSYSLALAPSGCMCCQGFLEFFLQAAACFLYALLRWCPSLSLKGEGVGKVPRGTAFPLHGSHQSSNEVPPEQQPPGFGHVEKRLEGLSLHVVCIGQPKRLDPFAQSCLESSLSTLARFRKC